MEEQAVSNPRDGSLLLQDVSAAARCGSPADPPPRSRDGGSPVSRSLVAAARAVRPPTGAGRPAVGLPFGRADAPSRGGRCNLRRAAPPTAATGSADSAPARSCPLRSAAARTTATRSRLALLPRRPAPCSPRAAASRLLTRGGTPGLAASCSGSPPPKRQARWGLSRVAAGFASGEVELGAS